MINVVNKLKFYLLYGLASILVVLSLFGGISQADTDLIGEFIEPAGTKGNLIYGGIKTNQVRETGNRVINHKAALIVRVIRLLLILTISLSVTMILYNGMVYIIETGQGKEGKSLAKNVVLIVVGILVALFSVVIINLIQSTTVTLNTELTQNSDTNLLKE